MDTISVTFLQWAHKCIGPIFSQGNVPSRLFFQFASLSRPAQKLFWMGPFCPANFAKIYFCFKYLLLFPFKIWILNTVPTTRSLPFTIFWEIFENCQLKTLLNSKTGGKHCTSYVIYFISHGSWEQTLPGNFFFANYFFLNSRNSKSKSKYLLYYTINLVFTII